MKIPDSALTSFFDKNLAGLFFSFFRILGDDDELNTNPPTTPCHAMHSRLGGGVLVVLYVNRTCERQSHMRIFGDLRMRFAPPAPPKNCQLQQAPVQTKTQGSGMPIMTRTTLANDRPRAKGVGVPLASRRGCSRAAPTKKRADLGSSCHVGHGSGASLVVGAIERQKLRN